MHRTITWWSQGPSVVEIFLSANGGSPQLFASSYGGGPYTQDASWIAANNTYVFTLYDYSSGSQGANLGSVSVTGVGPVPSFNSGVPESDLESVPSLSNGSTCTDITGAWDENTFPPASWILSQSGTQVSGTVQASDASCGTVTWQVAGSLTDPSSGMFTLNATNPQPFACQGNPFPSATDTVTLTAPACTSGNGVHTVPSGSFATTWTDPDPAPAPVPAKLSLVLGPKSTYSGVSVFDCNGRFRGAGWGYSRCATYTVLDQTQPGKPILNTTKYTANESVSVISTTYIVDLNTNSNASIKNDGKFTDFLTLVNPNGPIPAGTKGVTKQVITIIDTTNNAQYQVRVNCNVRTDSDVTVNDVTGKADQSCKGF